MYIGPKLFSVKPSLIAYMLITILLLSFFYVGDSVGYVKADTFVPEIPVDFTFNIFLIRGSYKGYINQAATKLEEVLSSKSYITSFHGFQYISTSIMIYSNNTSMHGISNDIHGMIFVVDNETKLDYLKVKILNATFPADGIYLRYDIAHSLGIHIGDIVGIPISYFLHRNVTVVGFFYSNYTEYIPGFIALSYTTFANKNISNVYNILYIADVNNSLILDRINPENTYNELTSLIKEVTSITLKNQLLSDMVGIYVSSQLLDNVNKFISWKNEFRWRVFVASLPAIASFWAISYFLIEMFNQKWKREINVLIARGFFSSIAFQSYFIFSFTQALLGLIIGILGSIGFSRVILIMAYSNADQYPIIVTSIESYKSLIGAFVGAFFVGFSVFFIVKSFNHLVSYMIRRKKRILKRIFMLLQGPSLDLTLIIYSLLVLYIYISFPEILMALAQSLSYASYNPIALLIVGSMLLFFLLAPFALVIGTTRMLMRLGRKFIINLTKNLSTGFKRLLIFGLRNTFREESKSTIVAVIFSTIIMLSLSATVLYNAYIPNAIAYEQWVNASDVSIGFTVQSNLTRIEEIAQSIISNVTDYISYSIVAVAQPYESMYSNIYIDYMLIGISSKSFFDCVYTRDGRTLADVIPNSLINTIKSGKGYSIASDKLKVDAGLINGSIIRYMSSNENSLVSVRIVGFTDIQLSPWFDFLNMEIRWYHLFFGSSYFSMGESPYDSIQYSLYHSQPVDEYLITDLQTVLAIDDTVPVSILIKISESANKTHVLETINRAFDKARSKYYELSKSVIRLTPEIINRTISAEFLRIFNIELNASYVASMVFVLITIWEYVTFIEKKRIREIAVLIAIGESRYKVSLILLVEVLFLLLYAIIFGFLSNFVFTYIYSSLFQIDFSFMSSYVLKINVLLQTVITDVFFFIFGLAFCYLLTRKVLKLDITAALKIEWIPEKFLSEIEVFHRERHEISNR